MQGAKYLLSDGKKIRFWLDVWMGECPLKVTFENSFKICDKQNETVPQLFLEVCWQFNFRRNFGPREMMEWDELQTCLSGVVLTEGQNKVRWELEKSGKFTMKSIYNHLLNTGVENAATKKIWQAKIPLKVKIFIWLLNKGRIQSVEQLKRKNLEGIR